jgi:hypothetical protein
MGRRYIGVEMGAHAVTHCAPRLKKVIAGEQGGISQAVGWTGGVGFRFYRLGPPIFDADGRINPAIRFAQLAAHVWFCETRTALHARKRGPLLGRHEGVACYLLFNGVLGDRRPDDSEEKYSVGKLWESTSGGRGVFLMTVVEANRPGLYAQIDAEIAGPAPLPARGKTLGEERGR